MAADLTVEVSLETAAVPESVAQRLEAAAEWALRSESVSRAIISITLVDDAEIARLNSEYLSHDGPTDVISFPFDTPDDQVIGDIYIGGEQAVRQAAEADVPADEEVIRLGLHGLLHVLGWEHPEDETRLDSEMFARQEALLRGWLDTQPPETDRPG